MIVNSEVLCKKYVLLNEVVGNGTYGIVYKGYEKKTSQKLAIKVIEKSRFPSSFQETLNKMIENETNILLDLLHPNILKLLAYEATNEKIYLITEYCDGGDLSLKQGQIPLRQTMNYFKQIIKGLVFAHENNYIHRDIKPANILLCKGIVKLADFGLSRIVDNIDKKSHMTVVGSPLYMAPEVYEEEKYCSKCDVWSAGILLYQMIYGETPWNAPSGYYLNKKIKSEPLKFPKNPEIDSNLKDLIKKMLELRQNDRIASKDILDHPAFKKNYDSELKEEMPDFIKHLKEKACFFEILAREIKKYGSNLNLAEKMRVFFEILFKKLEIIALKKIPEVCDNPEDYAKYLPSRKRKNETLLEFKMPFLDLINEKKLKLFKIIDKYSEKYDSFPNILSKKLKINDDLKAEYNIMFEKFIDKYAMTFDFSFEEIHSNEDFTNKFLIFAIKMVQIRVYEKIDKRFKFHKRDNKTPVEDYIEEITDMNRRKLVKKILKYHEIIR